MSHTAVPAKAPRQAAALAVAPEVIAGLALRKADAVAGRVRAFGVCSAATRENQHLAHVDERERRHSRHYIFHEQRYALGVVDQFGLVVRVTERAAINVRAHYEKRKRMRSRNESPAALR